MDYLEDHVLVGRAHADVRAGRTLPDVMGRALRDLDEHHPLALWEEFRAIDFGEDVSRATAAVVAVVGEAPPPAGLAAVWFGLYEQGNPDAENFANELTESVVALSGGTGYPDPDWAYAQEWYPTGYLPAPGLAGLASAAARADAASESEGQVGSAFRIATYHLAFAHSIGLAADVMRGDGGRALLASRDRLGVVSGFHDGDMAFLGELTHVGLDVPELRYNWV